MSMSNPYWTGRLDVANEADGAHVKSRGLSDGTDLNSLVVFFT